MMIDVIRKSDGRRVYQYEAEAPIEIAAFPFAEYEHAAVTVEPPSMDINPLRWRIFVGAFFDRFGDQRLPVLASDDALIQACVKDSLARQYIDLHERRAELGQLLGLIKSKGFAIDIAAILDAEPVESEVWHG